MSQTPGNPQSSADFNLEQQSIGKGNRPGSGVVTPQHLLYFGRNVLLAIVILMVAASWVYLWSDKDHFQIGKEIFEFAKITLPPIATLILGFYFRGSHNAD